VRVLISVSVMSRRKVGPLRCHSEVLFHSRSCNVWSSVNQCRYLLEIHFIAGIQLEDHGGNIGELQVPLHRQGRDAEARGNLIRRESIDQVAVAVTRSEGCMHAVGLIRFGMDLPDALGHTALFMARVEDGRQRYA
jgi:hypothetical protein